VKANDAERYETVRAHILCREITYTYIATINKKKTGTKRCIRSMSMRIRLEE
jgi:hypothetical protein